jgi:predicted site-specific integrase-resolvase
VDCVLTENGATTPKKRLAPSGFLCYNIDSKPVWLSETEDYMKRQPKQEDKKVYLYARLSHEDAQLGDSESIQNQRKLLIKYAEENSLTPYVFVYDDGFSGADGNRPQFRKMIEDE